MCGLAVSWPRVSRSQWEWPSNKAGSSRSVTYSEEEVGAFGVARAARKALQPGRGKWRNMRAERRDCIVMVGCLNLRPSMMLLCVGKLLS